MNRTALLVLLLLAALGALAWKLLQPMLSGHEAIQAEALRLDRQMQLVRVAVLELYASNGSWPKAEDLSGTAGLPLELLPNGLMKLRVQLPRYNIDSAFYYRPESYGMGIRWSCVVGDERLRPVLEVMPNCTFETGFDATKFVFDDGSGPKQKMEAASADACPPAQPPAAAEVTNHDAALVTSTPLGGGAYLLLGKATGATLPAVWNEHSRKLHPADPFWNAVSHTATPVGERAVLIAGGRRPDWTSGDETSDRVLLVAPCTRQVLGRGNLTLARVDHSAVRLDDHRVLIIGGETGKGVTAEVEVFDIQTMQSTPAQPLREARAQHLTVVLPDGRIMVIGGRGERDWPGVELYDPATGEWTTTGTLQAERRDGMTATVLADGRVLVIGGATPRIGSPMALAELWDPSIGAWQPVQEMITGRTGHAATLLPDGRVLVVGGAISAFSEIYDPRQNTWSLGPPKPARHKEAAEVFAPKADNLLIAAGLTVWNEKLRPDTPPPGKGLRVWRTAHAVAVLADGRLLISGGSNGADVLRHAEIYDPATDTSVETGQPHARRQNHRAFSLPDGQVVVLGGKGAWTDDGEHGEGVLPAELWDPAAQQWTVLPDLKLNEHEAASAVMLDTGDILFFTTGRAEQQPGSSHPEHETRVLLWQKASREVVEQGKLWQARESFRTAVVAGNRVLIAGGYERTRDNFKPSGTTELWDVAQRASIPMAQPDALFVGGSAHPPAPVLARLPDGRAFVIASGGGAIYDPKLDRWTLARSEFKPPTQGAALTTADGRMVTVTKKMGLPVEITLVNLLTGRSQVLKAPARQCARDPALTARAELIMIADDCMPGRPPNIERWQLGKL